MTAELTFDQWLEAYGASYRGADDAYTTPEWADKHGTTPRIINKWIDAGLKNGWMELVWVKRTDRTEVVRTRPAYRIKGQKTEPVKGKNRGQGKERAG